MSGKAAQAVRRNKSNGRSYVGGNVRVCVLSVLGKGKVVEVWGKRAEGERRGRWCRDGGIRDMMAPGKGPAVAIGKARLKAGRGRYLRAHKCVVQWRRLMEHVQRWVPCGCVEASPASPATAHAGWSKPGCRG